MKNILLNILICLISLPLWGQYELERTVVASTGSINNTAGTKTLGTSMGEAATATSSTPTYELTQGFQQGDLLLTAVEKTPKDAEIAVNLYPVPTRGQLNIDFGEIPEDEMQVSVWTTEGRELPLTLNNVSTNIQQLDLSRFNDGMYIIRIRNSETGEAKTYKVLKNSGF